MTNTENANVAQHGTIDFPDWVTVTKCKTHTHKVVIPTYGPQGCRVYSEHYKSTRYSWPHRLCKEHSARFIGFEVIR